MMRKYQWVDHNGERLRSVGILPDGTLWNPNGYLEEVVRTAVLAADARKHERRSQAAKKAAKTRDARQQHRIWLIAKQITEKQQTGPRAHCYVCGRHLDDPVSVERGIGSECWQHVLGAIERIRAGAAA